MSLVEFSILSIVYLLSFIVSFDLVIENYMNGNKKSTIGYAALTVIPFVNSVPAIFHFMDCAFLGNSFPYEELILTHQGFNKTISCEDCKVNSKFGNTISFNHNGEQTLVCPYCQSTNLRIKNGAEPSPFSKKISLVETIKLSHFIQSRELADEFRYRKLTDEQMAHYIELIKNK